MLDLTQLETAITPLLLCGREPWIQTESQAQRVLDSAVDQGLLMRSRRNGTWLYRKPMTLGPAPEPKRIDVRPESRGQDALNVLRERGRMTTTELGKALWPDLPTDTKDDMRKIRNRAQMACEKLLRKRLVGREKLRNGVFVYWVVEGSDVT